MPAFESTIIIIIALIITSGFFSLFEESLKTVRKARLHKKADDAERRAAAQRGARGRGAAHRYRRVLKAAENSGRYFMAARFWIIGSISVAAVLLGFSVGHLPAAPAAAMSLVLLTAAGIVLFTAAVLLVGSLAPRIIARRAPESIAASLLPLFEIFALPLRPVYFLMRIVGRRLQSVLPPQTQKPGMTEEELHLALMEGEKSGIVASKERTMVEGVFYLGDRPLGAFMTHRSDIQWLDINAPAQDIRAKALEYREQHCFPVADGALDAIIGAAYSEDIILNLASDSPAGLRAIMKQALFAPETMPALKAFESFRQGKTDFLFVMDEYGGFAGMLRLHDLMEEIVGELTAPVREEEQAVQREDGSWMAGGSFNIDDAAELFSLPGLAAASDEYHTLAGFVLSLSGELPHTGDSFVYQGYRFTVMEMDGNRIEKIAVTKEE